MKTDCCPHCGADDTVKWFYACRTRKDLADYPNESRTPKCYERELAAIRSRLERAESGLDGLAKRFQALSINYQVKADEARTEHEEMQLQALSRAYEHATDLARETLAQITK